MGILDAIVARKTQRLEAAQSEVGIEELKARAADMPDPRDFFSAVRAEETIRLIAEIKHATPSKGPLRFDFDPPAIASIYEGRADAISVITEEDFFLGHISFIGAVKSACTLPVLRKDFIISDYQLYEARAAGADAILLIADILSEAQAREFVDIAWELDLPVLFEAHDMAGLEVALGAGAPIVGINNRNLKTFDVDIDITLALRSMVPEGIPIVSESGISSREQMLVLQDAGVDAALVGTSIMEAADIKEKLDELRGATV